jgi:hypothetical protein
MRRVGALVAGGVVIVALVLAVSGYLGTWLGGSGDPECSALPPRTEAQQAIDDHPDLLSRLSAVGPGVEVRVSTPCPEPDAALVVVRVADDSQESRVEELLSEGEGLGVPTVVQRF